MTLEEDVEPVCVEGIETEAAYERLRDLKHISKADYWAHIIAERKASAFTIAAGCFLVSLGTPFAIAFGAVEIGAGVYYDWRLARQQQQAVKWLEANYLSFPINLYTT